MNKITKLIVGVVCALMLVTNAFAADTAVKATNTPVVVQTTKAPATSLFNAGEVGLSLSSGYDFGVADTVSRKTLFNDKYSANLTAGAFWFPLRNVGFEANIPIYQSQGTSVDEVQAGVILRVPLASGESLFAHIAPYVGVSGVYNWDAENEVAYIGKAGVEVRLNSKWGVFVEGQYRNDELYNWNLGQVSAQGGLKFVF